jgi:hypothetical protein
LAALRSAIELALLDHSLVWLIRVFDSVLIITALGWQQLRDLVDIARTTTPEWAGRVMHRLPDSEFVF